MGNNYRRHSRTVTDVLMEGPQVKRKVTNRVCIAKNFNLNTYPCWGPVKIENKLKQSIYVAEILIKFLCGTSERF